MPASTRRVVLAGSVLGLRRGHDYVHVAVDGHSRFGYAGVLPDEKGATTAGFLLRSVQAFALAGITINQPPALV